MLSVMVSFAVCTLLLFLLISVSCVLCCTILGSIGKRALSALLWLVAPGSYVAVFLAFEALLYFAFWAVSFTLVDLILVNHSSFYESVCNIGVCKVDDY